MAYLRILAGAFAILAIAGCGGDDDGTTPGEDGGGGGDEDAGCTMCCGGAPGCLDIMSAGGPTCCGDMRRDATCGGDGIWRCPDGFIPTTTCTGSWSADMCGMVKTPECTEPSQCALRAMSCCGMCGAATPDDMIALPTTEVAAYGTMVCEGMPGCPPCFSEQDPFLVATCSAADECVAINLHEDMLTECTTAADCVLASTRCCDCGMPENAVAYNPARGSFTSLICDSTVVCAPCGPGEPDFGARTADCQMGHCVVVDPGM